MWVCVEADAVPQAWSEATRNDGVLGSIPSVGSKKVQQTAAFLFRPTLANDAALPTSANIQPQIALFWAFLRMLWKWSAVPR